MSRVEEAVLWAVLFPVDELRLRAPTGAAFGLCPTVVLWFFLSCALNVGFSAVGKDAWGCGESSIE